MGTDVHARPFAASMRRWLWVIVAATILAGVIGYVMSSRSRPTYEATVRLLVGPYSADANTQKTAGSLAATYTYYVTSKAIIDATAADLGSVIDDQYAWGETLARADQLTRILSIKVKSDDAELAARIANLIAANLAAEVSRQNPRPEASLTVIEPAQPPASPIAPKPFRTALISAIAAFVAVLALGVLVETTGTRRTRKKLPPDAADLSGA